ncbi:hypothetical protein [Marisediminicola senii]|uniref:hypothetical protein n=1 Tax=Marisediminicola senii TaxID=2711233 RepID=UPI0013EC7A60|nr:hypothetical protein [Marisediminicola senii]
MDSNQYEPAADGFAMGLRMLAEGFGIAFQANPVPMTVISLVLLFALFGGSRGYRRRS